jgi:uncharacterized membrane protein YqjE
MSQEITQPHHPGLLAHTTGLLSSILKYAKARAVLLGIEAKEAGVQYGIAVALGISALVLAVLGYLFLVITAVFAVAVAFGGGNAWIPIMGVTALLHLAGAAALVLLGRRQVQANPFSTTLEELKKDQEWLSRIAKKD